MPGGLYPPPSVIASWPKPNYVDPDTQGNALTIVCILFSALSLATVTARTYSRIFITKAPGIDDLLIAVATCFGIALSVMLIIQSTTFYVGHHNWDIPVSKFAGMRKNIYISEWCYLAATCSVKISILLFYRRLSVTFSKAFLIATWVGIVYNVLFLLAFVLGLLLLFRPLDAYWLSFDPVWAATHSYSHGNEKISLPMSGALSVLGDFYSTLLPLLLIRFLNLPLRQKAALYSLFALGFLIVVTGIIRTILLDRLISRTYDVSWVLWEMWLWTVIEVNGSIFCASAPALKPFCRRFLIGPILSSGRKSPYALGSRRQSFVSKENGPRGFGWSNNSMKMRDSNVPQDVEKIGIVLSEPQSKAEMIEEEIHDGLSTRRYQLRTSRDGKLVPIQVIDQKSFDTRSATSSDYILPQSRGGDYDASTELRQYRAQIENLPPLPWQQQKQPQHISPSSGVREPVGRNLGQSTTRSRPGSDEHVRITAPQMQDSQHNEHTRTLSRSSDRNFSLPSTAVVGTSPYQHFERHEGEVYEQDRSSSEDILSLPRQGSRNGGRVFDVGYAV